MIDLTTVVVAAVSAMSGTGLTAFFTWWGNHESTGAAREALAGAIAKALKR